MFDLAFIWAGLIAFAVLAYVLFDGFDLGIGILFPLLDSEADRDQAMNSVAPVWDGNETWLILGGGGLRAAVPLVYAVVMPALYAPITAMLLGLIFRGVAFEFRWRTVRGKFLWSWAFAGGSAVAALAQGIALGALVQGVPVANRAYAGGWWDWLTWFSLLTGFALVVGYALLGATWLIMKTSGGLQAQARRFAWITGLATLALIGLVSLITPFLNPVFMQRWFAWPAIVYSAPVPIFVALAALALFWGLYAHRDGVPFAAAIALFVLSYIGLGISFYPYMLPPSITIWDAAAPDNSLAFLLVGAVVLIPLILAYTAWAYWVFRGKVGSAGGYH
ncbi:MAG: cytochrome d ubiquinol oxidase subunit II [Candidatus Rokuibacteriota bacterium]|nr:MAG: cytochrome d ubiquinol oxidase subunit II [Candidatus Rokubacteria bacterium]